jgi:2-polyprenyl-6-methoxyphenol hydroxylase-like FAD-dependent oxidoreductase
MSNKTVLISGAGISGPALAFWLKAAGFEPTLIERNPQLRTDGYVIDFWGPGYDIAERMGLTGELNRIGYHMREMRIVGDQGERVSGFGINVLNELTGGRFVTLRRSDLSRLLVEKIKDQAEVIFGDEIVGLKEHTDGVRVNFKHSRERHFDLVIGADGLHSRVRRLVFGAQIQFEKYLGYLIAAFEVRGYRPRDEDVYVTYNISGRMLGRVALRDDRTLFLFIFAVDPEKLPVVLNQPAQKAILREKFGDGKWECERILAELDHSEDLYFDRVSQIKMETWSRGRVALVGDAAFCVSLMAGQGSALGMTAAYVLAGELAKPAGRYDVAFASYEALLWDYIGSKQKGAQRFSAAFAPKSRWGVLFRNQVVRACAIPGVARIAFGRNIVDTLRLPAYAWPTRIPTAT